jgi:regulator of sigma E protease
VASNSIYFAAGLVITLSILIFVHELGHFLAAKRSGVRVEKFSIGFGPRLIGFTRGETEYVLSAIPFGGYVKMSGEDPEAVGVESDREFLSKSKRTRAFIVVAGPVMNFLLAIVLLTGLAGLEGIDLDGPPMRLMVAEDSPAAAAGLKDRDLVLMVNKDSVATWRQLDGALSIGLGRTIEMVIERGGRVASFSIDLSSAESILDVGIDVFYDPIIGDVAWRGPAHRAGLRGGDRILTIDGDAIGSWDDLRQKVLASSGDTLVMVWDRTGRELSASVVPREKKGYGLIEATPWIDKDRTDIWGSLIIGLRISTWAAKQISQFPRFVAELVRSGGASENVGGPIRIAMIAGDALRWGLPNFVWFLALISAQLAIVNLIPIPVLDGGHVLLLGVETVTGKPITTRQRIIAHQIGFAFLLGLMLIFTMSDIRSLFGW